MLTKNLPVKIIVQFSIVPVVIASLWSVAIVVGYVYYHLQWLAIPFLPVSLLGIAVSFYLGFKNSASNDRQNEARKNWEAIASDTKILMQLLDSYLPTQDRAAIRAILFRHIAWLYTHKYFLRHHRMDWEHNLSVNNRYRKRFQQDFNINTALEEDVTRYLPANEYAMLKDRPDKAAVILQSQSRAIRELWEQNKIDDLRLIELQKQLSIFYQHQGQNERIKTFPIPRQYANYAYLFVVVFVFLLPFGLLSEMQKINTWFTVPFSVLLSWVFMQMEMIGDYSENPFEGLILDVPITAITRNLEIEILTFLGETWQPAPVGIKKGVLM